MKKDTAITAAVADNTGFDASEAYLIASPTAKVPSHLESR